MMGRIVGVLALAICGVATGAEVPGSFADARAIWQSSRENAEYQNYVDQFTQYSNSLRLDERNGCHSLAAGTVTLMLVVARADADGFATIERVFYDVDNAKARCFERSYAGVRTKVPPFLPFVLQVRME